MVNKKNIWFLTLFSLILVLSIYYITMPNELLITSNNKENNENLENTKVSIEETSIISSLNVEYDNKVLNDINELKEKLTSKDISNDEKNLVFEELKTINKNSSKEESIESKIKATYTYDNFVKITNDQVRVVVGTNDHDVSLANNIMRLVQSEFDQRMYISIEFQV